MRRLAIALSFLIALTSMSLPRADAQQEPTLIAAWDATAYVSCTLEYQLGDGPWTPITCPPGSVIFAGPVTADQAMTMPGSLTVPVTGSVSKDRAIADLLANELRMQTLATSGDMVALGGCDGQRRNVNGSYVVGESGSDPARVYWAIGYTVAVDCDVTAVRDRDKVGPSNNGRARWQKSCSDGNSLCYSRNIVLYEDWTSIQNAQPSVYGAEYRNVSSLNCTFCTWYYGYWSFD